MDKKELLIENSSVLNIKGGLFGDVKWNTNLNEAPFETLPTTTIYS